MGYKAAVVVRDGFRKIRILAATGDSHIRNRFPGSDSEWRRLAFFRLAQDVDDEVNKILEGRGI